MYPLDRLTQISVQKAKQFLNAGITSIEELAEFFPRKYYDFREVTSIRDLKLGEVTVVYGKVIRMMVGKNTNTLVIQDKDGYCMNISWFHTDYFFKKFRTGDWGYFSGKVTEFQMSWVICNPITVSQNAGDSLRIHPIYSKIKGMSDAYLKESIEAALNFLELNQNEPKKDLLAKNFGLVGYLEALREIHIPTSRELYKKARTRVAFEAIYHFYDMLKEKESLALTLEIGPLQESAVTEKFIDTGLPFKLTPGQTSAVASIMSEVKAGRRLHSLISGDVGCGKTVVAIITVILMAENRFQTAIIAPSIVLAKQHYEEFVKMTAGVRIAGHELRIALLTGETKRSDRKKLLGKLEKHEVDVLIGTHALLSRDIKFARLGMTIIDEEHKFGVMQKAELEEYDRAGIHHLAMTATPIPRSIAMTLYGRNVAVLPIQTMPQGRKETITRQCFRVEEAFQAIQKEIHMGHQAYIICPFIETSKDEKFQEVISVVQAEEMLRAYIRRNTDFTPRVKIISGDMKAEDILTNINLFETGQADILISTSIVEVGVNVPNATAICIMSAGRFGLAALHQLRGRVGRNSLQGYCLLYERQRNEKLDILCSTTNGFEIAEKDLKIRGPGDLMGDRQTGISKIIDLMIARPKLTALVRQSLFEGAPYDE